MSPVQPASAQDEVSDLLNRINDLRVSLGLHAYTINGSLAAAARQQAQWMAETGSISHVQPDGSTPRVRALANGYISTDVSENIYGGTNASVATAWNFWINSPIHYRGLTNGRYREVGIGAVHGESRAAYVLVFGNPGGLPPPPPAVANALGEAAGGPPSYVLGVDENGYILHEIQPGDTLGDIALIYGYLWEDIPAMMTINHIEDNRTLEIGAVFLVPPHEGTYTPTPADAQADDASTITATPQADSFVFATNTPRDDAAAPVPSATSLPTNTPIPSTTPTATITASPILPPIATSDTFPEEIFFSTPVIVPTATASPTHADIDTPVGVDSLDIALVVTDVAAVNTPGVSGAIVVRSSDNGRSRWIMVAVVVQGLVLLGAAFEFVRRMRQR